MKKGNYEHVGGTNPGELQYVKLWLSTKLRTQNKKDRIIQIELL